MKKILTSLFVLVSLCVSAQDLGFPYGKVSYRELEMAAYEKDTLANAVVLNEFGEAHIDNGGDHNLIFEYHTKIKILKKSGLSLADFEIPLFKNDNRSERIWSIKASSFNVENGSLKEVPLQQKNIFTENRSKYLDVKKFAIPNVRVGSVIEIQYVLESPFISNFRSWHFQAEYPKIKSEYCPLIPGNYIYNMTIRGPFELTENKSEVVKGCFTPGGGYKADCVRYTFAMQDIPAFIEEDYMTAKSNFISSINFELSEIRYFDGRIDKVTKEWKDAEDELRKDNRFGLQLKRGRDIVDNQIEKLLIGETDPLKRAKKTYDFIKNWYRWDEVRGKYSEFGIKKAFENKTGNVGDINLSLIAALRFAGLQVEPVILSTRDNGLPIEIHPVLTDFNYVIAKVTIGDKTYLADATDDFYPFGMLPERCLNGKGRVLGEEESYWIDLKPSDKSKTLSVSNLKLSEDGIIRGSIDNTYMGYEAVSKREEIYSCGGQEEYADKLKRKVDNLDLKKIEIANLDDFEKPVIQKLQIEMDGYEPSAQKSFLFSPFIFDKWKENPFKASERLYPVDFGTPVELTTVLNLEFPPKFEIVNLPEKVGLSLPNNGGRYMVNAQVMGNKLVLSSTLVINKTIFTSEEYHFLKELFNRVIQVQNHDLLFKKKEEQ